MSVSTRQRLRMLAEARRGILVPGAFNALSAKVIADLGFEVVYVTGAGVTNMWFALPDQGVMGLAEIADHTARIRDAVDLPLIVDADTGFGNALNVRHTVRVLERAGADCIQFEDQVAPKRCGHFSGKEVIDADEAVAKIRAAVDARRDPDLLILARTDARGHPGLRGCHRARRTLRRGRGRYSVRRGRDHGRGDPGATRTTAPTAADEPRDWREDADHRRRGTGTARLWLRAVCERRAAGGCRGDAARAVGSAQTPGGSTRIRRWSRRLPSASDWSASRSGTRWRSATPEGRPRCVAGRPSEPEAPAAAEGAP